MHELFQVTTLTDGSSMLCMWVSTYPNLAANMATVAVGNTIVVLVTTLPHHPNMTPISLVSLLIIYRWFFYYQHKQISIQLFRLGSWLGLCCPVKI